MIRTICATVAAAAGLAACATAHGPPKLPSPPANDALKDARVTVFRVAATPSPSGAMAEVCATTAGYCAVPRDTPTGLRCTCEAQDGSYAYAGTTGPVPSMPDWADNGKRQR